MADIPHVALLIETSRGHGRGILQGIIRYVREHGPWSLYLQPQGLEAPPPRWLKDWKGDGILARINDQATAQAVRKTKLPAVDMRFRIPKLGLPCVGIDNVAVVRMAFEYLRSCGFQQFACCGLPRGENPWMDLRCDTFAELSRAAGCDCQAFQESPAQGAGSWEEAQAQLAAWVSGLARPIAVFACNDDRGQQILDACQRVGLHVPDEVAVLGVDNDELLCNLANPPLSSVDIHSQRIGYEAAALLDRLMAGEKAPKGPLFCAPLGIVARKSTDVLATEDRELARAIRHLREHACQGLRLKDFLRGEGFGRRSLERRVQKLLGHSPKEEITRVRIERAKQLLSETDLPAGVVAAKCGFAQPKYFSEVFRAKVGTTPAAYRRRGRRLDLPGEQDAPRGD